MSTINVNEITDLAGTGAPDFPNGIQIEGNNITDIIPDAGSFSYRNKIINGNFDIWQRGTSISSTGLSADRWKTYASGSSATFSRESFTLGQTNVPNEPFYFHRTDVSSVTGSSNFVALQQKIESVRTFAGQTVTLSFWAKSGTSRDIAVEFSQTFGIGGSAPVYAIDVTTCSLTSAWKKFTITTTLPSISGKTIGDRDALDITFWFDAGSDNSYRTNNLGNQSGIFDIAQVQLEAGSSATPFEIRPAALELTLCEKYYQIVQSFAQGAYYVGIWTLGHSVTFKTTMRAVPSVSTTFIGTGGYNSGFNTPFITNNSIAWNATMNAGGGFLYVTHTADAEV